MPALSLFYGAFSGFFYDGEDSFFFFKLKTSDMKFATPFLIVLTCFIFSPGVMHRVMAQSAGVGRIGINTNTPQATLHVHGRVRIDTLPDAVTNSATGSSINIMTADSVGNAGQMSLGALSALVADSGDHPVLLPYDDAIAAGDMVCVGDGKSAYMSCSGDGAFSANESVDNVRWVAQGFRSTPVAKSIRAVQINLPITSGATHHFNFLLRPAVGGVPGPTNVAADFETFVGAATVTGWSLFVFDPPLPVTPSTDYYLIIQAYTGTSTSRNVRTVANSIMTGTLAITTNAGSTWTTYPTRDVEVQIYEVRSVPGKVYRAQSVMISETLRPDQGTILATSGLSATKDRYDKAHGFIGVAKESGSAGNVKKVSLGPLVTKAQSPKLVPGIEYILDAATPGRLISLGSTSLPAGYFNVKVGFAADSTHLFITR